jgi:outer membrane protein
MFLILSVSLSAQEKWTLKDCILFGIKNNLNLHDAELTKQIAGQSLQQSKWNLLPGIAAGSDAGLNFGRSIDPNTNGIVNTSFFNNSYYVGASVDLFDGFKLQNQISYQKFRKEAAGNNFENATDDLAFQVMNAFYSVIYQQELLKIANEQKTISEMNVKKMEILVSTGLKAPTDLLEVKANYEKDELFCIQTSNNIASAWISLKKAMNLSSDKEITLVSIDENQEAGEISADTNDLFKQTSQWSPYIRMYENEWKASLRQVKMSRSGFFPSIQLQASWNTGYYETNKDASNQTIAFNNQIKNNRSQFVGASLNIPIFSKNSVRSNVKQSKFMAEQAETKLNEAKQTLIYEMEQNNNELTAAWKESLQARKQLEADSLSFHAAQKKFDQGLINVVEFYTVKNRLATTSAELLNSKLTLEIKKRILDFYKGSRFWQ